MKVPHTMPCMDPTMLYTMSTGQRHWESATPTSFIPSARMFTARKTNWKFQPEILPSDSRAERPQRTRRPPASGGMVRVTVWRVRVGSFGSSVVVFIAEKLYSGGAGDAVANAIRDAPKQGPPVEAAAADRGANARRWKECSSRLIDEIPASLDDGSVLASFASFACSMCQDSPDMQTHGEGSTYVCASVATGTRQQTDKVVAGFDLSKLELPDDEKEEE